MHSGKRLCAGAVGKYGNHYAVVARCREVHLYGLILKAALEHGETAGGMVCRYHNERVSVFLCELEHLSEDTVKLQV